MASAGTVSIDFAAETARFTSELKKVQGSLKRLEGDFKSVERVAGVALRFFSGAVLAGFAKQAFAAADATATAAERAGIAVESFSRLQFAAGQMDVEMSALTSGIQRFQVALANADSGNKEAQRSLARFNLQARNLSGLAVEDQLAEVAEAFKRITDPADRTRDAVELFGRSAGPQLVPFLAQGREGIRALTAEADRLGITMSNSTAQGIDQADRAIKALTATLSAFASKFAAGLSIVILGSPDEQLRLDDRITELTQRRDQLLQGGVGGKGGASSAGRSAFRSELAAINEELKSLIAEQKVALGLITPARSLGPERRTGGAEFSSQLAEIDIEAIQAMKIPVDEVNEAFLRLEETVARIRQEQFTDALQIAADAAAGRSKEIEAQISDNLTVELERRSQAAQFWREREVQDAQTAEAIIRGEKATTTNYTIGLLQALGVKSKAFAVAAIVLEKATAIQRLLFANSIAAELAFSSQLIPAIPASLATATAAKAAVLAQGRIQAALIGATGALQIANVASGGASANIGTPLNPISTSPVFGGDSEQFGATSQNAIQIIIANNVGFDEHVTDQIIAAIREAADDRDVILFGPNSRQAQDLVTT